MYKKKISQNWFYIILKKKFKYFAKLAQKILATLATSITNKKFLTMTYDIFDNKK